MFVGRAAEIAELSNGLQRVPSGTGALYLLAGEPGIGKSRLAIEVASLAPGHRVTTAWGRCWEAGGAPTFWPWREAFEALDIPFPDPGAIAHADPAEARFALFREGAKSLARAAAKSPLLVILEDLHAADRSTLLMLELVASQLRDMPVMVIGTYRDLEAHSRDDLADAIARLARIGRLLHLSRLDELEVGLLVRNGIAGADESLAAGVFETTQGNPLFVAEILRDIHTHGRRSGVPLGVREVIRQRLALVSADTRAALEAAAVLGVEHSAAEVARMHPGAIGALDEAVGSGVLVTRGDRLRFSHALYRESLYFELSAARRHALHREAALALTAVGQSLAARAHHLLEAGPDCAAEAVERAIEAASLATDTFAFDDALSLLDRARAAIPSGHSEATLRCRVMIALGETRLRAGDQRGRALCVEAADLARELGDAELLAHAALAYGSVFLMGGVDPLLVSTLEQALVRMPDADSSLRARTMARLASARQPSPPADRPRDIQLGLAAIEMARRVASGRELLDALHSASGVLYNAVDPVVRIPVSREQERLAEQLGDTSRLLQARARLAIDHLEQANLAAYAQVAESYQTIADRVGPAAAPWRVPLMRSMIAVATDRFADSERWQLESQRIDAEQPRARRAQAFHRIGFLRAAERHTELRAAIPELRGLWLSMPYGTVLADAHVASILARIGADDDLRALLAELPAPAFREEINASALADAMWATGDVELAKRVQEMLGHRGDRWCVYWFDCEITDGPNTRALAYIAAIHDRWDECERLFARAVALVEGVGWRSLVARMHFEMGDLMIRKGHAPEHARALIARAHDEASAVGLPDLVALIERRHPWGAAHARRGEPLSGHAAAPSVFTMRLEGEYYAMPGTHGVLRFKASRGMHYLAQLLARPDTEIHVLELVGSSDHVDRGDAGERIDATAVRAYRARLEALREALESAEELGDVDGAERARDEMEAIARELASGTQKGGRVRRTDSAVDRARSAVQRRIKDALGRIAEQDAELGAALRNAVRTGNHCIYRPFS